MLSTIGFILDFIADRTSAGEGALAGYTRAEDITIHAVWWCSFMLVFLPSLGRICVLCSRIAAHPCKKFGALFVAYFLGIYLGVGFFGYFVPMFTLFFFYYYSPVVGLLLSVGFHLCMLLAAYKAEELYLRFAKRNTLMPALFDSSSTRSSGCGDSAPATAAGNSLAI